MAVDPATVAAAAKYGPGAAQTGGKYAIKGGDKALTWSDKTREAGRRSMLRGLAKAVIGVGVVAGAIALGGAPLIIGGVVAGGAAYLSGAKDMHKGMLQKSAAKYAKFQGDNIKTTGKVLKAVGDGAKAIGVDKVGDLAMNFAGGGLGKADKAIEVTKAVAANAGKGPEQSFATKSGPLNVATPSTDTLASMRDTAGVNMMAGLGNPASLAESAAQQQQQGTAKTVTQGASR